VRVPYLTDTELLAALAARFMTTPTALVERAPQWTDIVRDANTDAYALIREVLVGRGYALADIDAWDRRRDFNRRIGLCNALTEGAGIAPREINWDAVDRICAAKEELAEVLLTVDAVPADLEAAGTGVSHGDMDRGDEVFREENWPPGIFTADDTCRP
jgi:hypothetical protein